MKEGKSVCSEACNHGCHHRLIRLMPLVLLATILILVVNISLHLDNRGEWAGRKIETNGRFMQPQPLQIIAPGFATDGVYVYSSDQVIWKADPATFVVLAGGYVKDAERVYFAAYDLTATMIGGADSATFVTFDSVYAKDARRVYYSGQAIDGADQASFTLLGNTGYAKDNKAVYYYGLPIVGADVATFEVPSNYYMNGYDARDAHKYYSGGTEITKEQVEENLKLQDSYNIGVGE